MWKLYRVASVQNCGNRQRQGKVTAAVSPLLRAYAGIDRFDGASPAGRGRKRSTASSSHVISNNLPNDHGVAQNHDCMEDGGSTLERHVGSRMRCHEERPRAVVGPADSVAAMSSDIYAVIVGRSGRQFSAGDGVPVIAGSPLFGAARDLQRDLLGTFDRAMLAHGGAPVRFRVGPPRLGFVAEAVFRPEDARQVLATDAARYDKRVPALEEFRRFVGDGLLTSDGDRWRRDRRIVAPLFTRRRITSYVASMALSAEALAASWGPVADEGGEVDLREPAMLYALEVLGTTVFGEDMEATEAVVRSSVPVLNEQVTRTALSPVRLPSWFPTPANRRAERARRAVWEFVERLIARRRAAALRGPEEGTDEMQGGPPQITPPRIGWAHGRE